MMNIVTVTPNFEVVIPEDIREEAGIRPGQQFDVIRLGKVIELVPVQDIRSACGCLPGLNADGLREEPDRI